MNRKSTKTFRLGITMLGALIGFAILTFSFLPLIDLNRQSNVKSQISYEEIIAINSISEIFSQIYAMPFQYLPASFSAKIDDSWTVKDASIPFKAVLNDSSLSSIIGTKLWISQLPEKFERILIIESLTNTLKKVTLRINISSKKIAENQILVSWRP
ncbi:MAG: hypothetical protein HQM10_12600 [Candidatus Riflebacteria bacterium]|nr:hypothetical protein [Candidatus Riflebacteria bacterium]